MRSRREGRSRTAERGQALVEYALVVPVFFLLVFGLMDFGRLFYTQLTLQYALREAGRFAVTGQHLTDSSGQTMSRIASIRQVAQQAASGIDISGIQISSTLTPSGRGSAGGPGDTMTIVLTYNLTLLTPIIGRFFGPNGIYTSTVSTSFRNEPFAPWQQE